jgi:uncharacterized protein YdhG (YjbR/CyaY superfamily)
MTSKATTVEEYLLPLTDERKESIQKLRAIFTKYLPKGFEECISYGMIGYVVPKKTYPAGYHCNSALPLPFINIASQKNFIAIYHMGIYANPTIFKWFVDEYAKQVTSKLDMGKSCIRFKKTTDIPYTLIEELAKKITVKEWIETYEKAFVKK